MPPSRRRLLRAAAGVTAALAGCGDVGNAPIDRPTAGPRSEPVRPLAVVHARSDSNEPLFRVRDEDDERDGTDGDDAGTTTSRTRRGVRDADHLTDREEVDRLAFADSDAAAELETAVDDTDFERHSVYLLQHRVGECYRLHLTEVSRRDDSVHVSLCRGLQGANVECSADRSVWVGYAVRLPFPGDDFSGMGMGYSTRCPPNAENAVRTRTGGDG